MTSPSLPKTKLVLAPPEPLLSDDGSKRSSSRRKELGPVVLSWAAAATSMACQTVFTDWSQLRQDNNFFWDYFSGQLPGNELLLGIQHDLSAGYTGLYAFLWVNIVVIAFFFIPYAFPAKVEVPDRSRNTPQYELTILDYSVIGANTLCMPGFFYHFFCLLRSWWLAAPLTLDSVGAEAGAEFIYALTLYMLVYELIYYWWHRSLHEVPMLYKWVHMQHHSQTRPDRPALDTLNTHSVESQVGAYMQLFTLWACGKFLGITNVPAGIMFFEFAGWLSILEHDKFDRNLPFDIWRADDHHMHHAFVKCNYGPYSVFVDKIFGTYKPFAVKPLAAPAPNSAGDDGARVQQEAGTESLLLASKD